MKSILCTAVAFGLQRAALGAGDACNFGPTHHSHLVLPHSNSKEECVRQDATFLLSHGATFFCPHTFDVKLLGTIEEDAAREKLCEFHFSSIERNDSSKMLLRPTLPAGGLPALARGESSTWSSPVMYHIHNFGKDNSAGPDNGWNVTVVRNETTTVHFRRIYGRELDVQPRPPSLTYLAHDGGSAGRAILSHYISTSGASGFDQLLKVDFAAVNESVKSQSMRLRDTWPIFLTFPDRRDVIDHRLYSNDSVEGFFHTYDSQGLPKQVKVKVSVTLDYYFGRSDGFAGFETMCPMEVPNPQSPSTCLSLSETHSA